MLNASRLLCAVVVLFPILTSSAAAQYSERVDVSIASIDVVVRDRAGNLVHGLTKDDFDVYENGQLQKITNFSAIDVSAPDAEPISGGVAVDRSSSSAVRAPRLLVLYFDVNQIDPRSRKEFFRSVRTFADTALRDGDFGTILTWTNRVRLALPPTSDRAALLTVIDQFADQGFSPLWETLRRAQETRRAQAEEAEEFARQVGMQSASDPGANTAFEEFARTEDLCGKIKRKAKEMRNLLTHLTRVEMKKVLLFASDNVSLNPSRTCGTSLELTALTNTANAYGITIHGLHPPGPRTTFVGPDKGGFLPKTDAPAPMATAMPATSPSSGRTSWPVRTPPRKLRSSILSKLVSGPIPAGSRLLCATTTPARWLRRPCS